MLYKQLLMEKNMANTIAKINHSTRKALGTIGRPVAVATGAGFGAFYAGQKFDIGFLQDGYNCAGVGVVTAIGTELALDHWGDTSVLEAVDAASTLKESKDLTVESLVAAGMSQEDAQLVITGLQTQKAVKQAQAKPRVAAS